MNILILLFWLIVNLPISHEKRVIPPNLLSNHTCNCNPTKDSTALITFRNSIKIREIEPYHSVVKDYRENFQKFDELWPLNNPISTWEGIKLNEEGCVEEIVLINKSLQGKFPAKILMELPCIKVLNFESLVQNNYIYSIDTYEEYGQNRLSGDILDSIKYSTSLEVLNLSYNFFSGKIPSDFFKHPSLKEIIFKDNALSGFVEWTLENPSNFEIIDLSENNLQGSLPTNISEFSNLKILNLQENKFFSNIPSSIGELSNLKILNLFSNNMDGEIPSSIGNLTKLKELSLSGNFIGTVPDKIENLTSLKKFVLSGNFTGPFPLGITNLISLEELNLGFNKMNSTIPPEIGNLINLKKFALSMDFSGNLPMEFGNLTKLEELDLSIEKIKSKLPDVIGELRNLNKLKISADSSGHLTKEIGNLVQLEELELIIYDLTGNLPVEIGKLQNLKKLYIYADLIGEIPTQIGNLVNLEELDISRNELIGSIPNSIGNLIKLKRLDLASNELSGEIPKGLGSLTHLEELLLNQNQLEGRIPEGLATYVDLSQNLLSGAVPATIEGNIVNNYLDSLPPIPQDVMLRAGENRFTFDDIIPNRTLFREYFSHKPFRTDTNYIFSECIPPIIDLKIDKDIPDNTYSWYKNRVKIAETNSSQLDLSTIYPNLEDYEGFYSCSVSNPRGSTFAIFSEKIHVHIIDENISNENYYFNEELCYGEQIKILNKIYSCNNPYEEGQITDSLTGCLINYIVDLQCNSCTENLDIPNAFSPNEDRVNETFTIPQIIKEPNLYGQNELWVYNRNKQLVFYSKNYGNDWDGTDKGGKKLPIGTYFYIFEYGAGQKRKDGIVTIIR